MTPEQFVYWLQGFMEMADPKELNKTQTTQIKDHLKLVFDKKTPEVSLPSIQHTEPFRITPYQITCDDNNNFPDLMTTPVCSGTTITTTPLDSDVKNESKRVKFGGIKC
jgi:hypothetical protein